MAKHFVDDFIFEILDPERIADYSHRELAWYFGAAANETDTSLYDTLVIAYVESTVKFRKKIRPLPEEKAFRGGLENVACYSFLADNMVTLPLDREPLCLIYSRPSNYGPAMRKFSEFIGLSGADISKKFWPEKYEAECEKIRSIHSSN